MSDFSERTSIYYRAAVLLVFLSAKRAEFIAALARSSAVYAKFFCLFALSADGLAGHFIGKRVGKRIYGKKRIYGIRSRRIIHLLLYIGVKLRLFILIPSDRRQDQTDYADGYKDHRDENQLEFVRNIHDEHQDTRSRDRR